MFDPEDLINFELCFPGSLTGETEIECPYCRELLTVPVDDPLGEDTFACCECGGVFEVNWAESRVKYERPTD